MQSLCREIKDNIRKISVRLMQIREREDIKYRPYTVKNDIRYDFDGNGSGIVNLGELYPNAEPGDEVYVGTNLYSAVTADIVLHVKGNIAVYFNNETIYDFQAGNERDENGFAAIPLKVKKNDNYLLFKCRCLKDEPFEFRFMPDNGYYKWWLKDYLYHSRATSPLDCFYHEDGVAVSDIYGENDVFDGKFVYPKLPEVSNRIDFREIYGDAEKGRIIYALTYAVEDTELSLSTDEAACAFVNGKAVNIDKTLFLKKGDELLVKILYENGGELKFSSEDNIGIPFLHSHRGHGDKWIVVGGFGSKKAFGLKYGPEIKVDICHPYYNEDMKQLFWRLPGKDTYVRAYMDSVFFSQWFYANMVGQYGLLKAGNALAEEEYRKYFFDSMQNMAKYYQYCRYEAALFKKPNFLMGAMNFDVLDNIGVFGINMIEAYKLCPDGDIFALINILDEAAGNNVRRLEDGTYCRTNTMWADDTYMGMPFLARMGRLKGDTRYFDECMRQYRGYRKRLYMKEKQIYSHIFFLDVNKPNGIPWGRGNGWVLNSMTDVCEIMPGSYEGKQSLIDMIRELADGLAELQDSDGLWHQVLDCPDSYAETSATGMFLLGLCRGLNNGWLSREKFESVADRAYKGLTEKKIDEKGNIYGVCRGSGCSMDAEYYKNLLAIDNDDHGAGIILSALSEYLKYNEEVRKQSIC